MINALLLCILYSQCMHQIWIIDHQSCYIAEELRQDLGDWIHRQITRNIPRHRDEGADLILNVPMTIRQLRNEWNAQKEMQTSVRECMFIFLARKTALITRIRYRKDSRKALE